MHDPMTVAFEIPSYEFRQRHRWVPHLVTVWHVDPERDGTDDSCGWFMRSRHGDKATLDRIAKGFEFQWTYGVPVGWFGAEGKYNPHGDPNFSAQAITLGMFRIAVNVTFGHWSGRADRFLRRHLHDILAFAENSCDSLCTTIWNSYHRLDRDGEMRERDHQERIRSAASCVYSWILRADRQWWKHPRWHVWHWRLQVHPWQKLRRWLLTRCEVCGRRFRWNEPVIGTHWDSPRRRWLETFRGERDCRHERCSREAIGVQAS